MRTFRPALSTFLALAAILLPPSATHADASLPAAPQSACRRALSRAEAAFVEEVGGHAGAFESHFRPALRACLATR